MRLINLIMLFNGFLHNGLLEGDGTEFYSSGRRSRWYGYCIAGRGGKQTKSAKSARGEKGAKGNLSPLRGWFGYFKHSYKTTFPPIDGWVRMRLRSILRKRQKKKGRGRGSDHQRWPNAYFAAMGLYSLTAAHRTACQSMTMAH
jgi:hypothetical protein